MALRPHFHSFVILGPGRGLCNDGGLFNRGLARAPYGRSANNGLAGSQDSRGPGLLSVMVTGLLKNSVLVRKALLGQVLAAF